MLALLIWAGLVLAPDEVRGQPGRTSSEAISSGVSSGHAPTAPAAPPAMRAPPTPSAPIAPPAPMGFPMPGQGQNQSGFGDRFRNPGVVYSPPVVYGVPYPVPVPYDSGAAPSYDAAYPGYDAPYPSYGAPPPPPSGAPSDGSPVPGVLLYPSGRYELRGDGAADPYRWVWIPNPPPPPPTAPPGAAPPSGPPGVPAPSGPTVPPAPPTPTVAPPRPHDLTVYRWTDREGIVHFTDSFDAVPKEYRSQAKPIN